MLPIEQWNSTELCEFSGIVCHHAEKLLPPLGIVIPWEIPKAMTTQLAEQLHFGAILEQTNCENFRSQPQKVYKLFLILTLETGQECQPRTIFH